LQFALEQYLPQSPDEISLDVHSENVGPRRWYSGLGFAEVSRAGLELLENPLAEGFWSEDWFVVGFSQSKAVHHRFGFSHFSLSTPQREYRVTVIGDGIAVTDGVVSDSAAIAALQYLLPGRTIRSFEPVAASSAKPSVVRMSADFDRVLSELSARASRMSD
jgi:hypothetical protein